MILPSVHCFDFQFQADQVFGNSIMRPFQNSTTFNNLIHFLSSAGRSERPLLGVLAETVWVSQSRVLLIHCRCQFAEHSYSEAYKPVDSHHFQLSHLRHVCRWDDYIVHCHYWEAMNQEFVALQLVAAWNSISLRSPPSTSISYGGCASWDAYSAQK